MILCAQAALEAIDALSEYPGDDLLLTLVERAAMLLVELRLGDVEIHTPDGVVLGFQNRVRKYSSRPVIPVSLLLRSNEA